MEENVEGGVGVVTATDETILELSVGLAGHRQQPSTTEEIQNAYDPNDASTTTPTKTGPAPMDIYKYIFIDNSSSEEEGEFRDDEKYSEQLQQQQDQEQVHSSHHQQQVDVDETVEVSMIAIIYFYSNY